MKKEEDKIDKAILQIESGEQLDQGKKNNTKSKLNY